MANTGCSYELKYNPNFERDWVFYLKNVDRFTFSGKVAPSYDFDPNGKDAKFCFWKYDSTGKMLPCREPELLSKVMHCKASINWQIKDWASGFWLTKTEWDDFMVDIGAPDWVTKAVFNMMSKK